MDMSEIERKAREQGYIICRQSPEYVLVWKNGLFGALDYNGEELAPCAYTTGVEVELDSRGYKGGPGIQKIIKDSLSDKSRYSPYKGAIVSRLLKALDIPETGSKRLQRDLTREEYERVVCSLYTIVDDTIEKGGKSFTLFDRGTTDENFIEFMEKLEKLTGIEDYSFESSLAKRIELLKLTHTSVQDLHYANILQTKKAVFTIGTEESEYYSEDGQAKVTISAKDYEEREGAIPPRPRTFSDDSTIR